jgi:hypothetical protein
VNPALGYLMEETGCLVAAFGGSSYSSVWLLFVNPALSSCPSSGTLLYPFVLKSTLFGYKVTVTLIPVLL